MLKSIQDKEMIGRQCGKTAMTLMELRGIPIRFIKVKIKDIRW